MLSIRKKLVERNHGARSADTARRGAPSQKTSGRPTHACDNFKLFGLGYRLLDYLKLVVVLNVPIW